MTLKNNTTAGQNSASALLTSGTVTMFQAGNAPSHFITRFMKGPAIVKDVQDFQMNQVSSRRVEFECPLHVDIFAKVYFHVILPALSAQLGEVGYVTKFTVANKTNTSAVHNLLYPYASYGTSETNQNSNPLTEENVSGSTLIQRAYARGKWRNMAHGDANVMDRTTLNNIIIDIYTKAGGRLLDRVQSSLEGTQLYEIDLDSMLVAHPDALDGFAQAAYATTPDSTLTFLGAQRKLWACYSTTALGQLTQLRDTVGGITGQVSEMPAGMALVGGALTPISAINRPAPYNSPAIAGRNEPTETEAQEVANHVFSYWFARSSFVTANKGAQDQGINSLAQSQYRKFDDLSLGADSWTPKSNSECIARWCDGVAYKIAQTIHFNVGNQHINALRGDFLFIKHELGGVAGRRHREMVGFFNGDLEALTRWSKSIRHIYLPLDFWFTGDYKLAFKNYLCNFSSKKIVIELCPITELVVVNHPRVQVFVASSSQGSPGGSGQQLMGIDTDYTNYFDFGLTLQNVYLTKEDRDSLSKFSDMFARDISQMTPEQIKNDPYVGREVIEQIQYKAVDISGGSLVDHNLPTNSIAKYHLWYFQRNDAYARGDYFDFSGVDGEDPMVSVGLKINENVRWGDSADYTPAVYFRLLQSSIYWNSLPSRHIYSYSYCMYPQSPNYTGALNLARCTTAKLSAKLQAGMPMCRMHFYTAMFNVLYYTRGTVAQVYNISLGDYQ